MLYFYIINKANFLKLLALQCFVSIRWISACLIFIDSLSDMCIGLQIKWRTVQLQSCYRSKCHWLQWDLMLQWLVCVASLATCCNYSAELFGEVVDCSRCCFVNTNTGTHCCALCNHHVTSVTFLCTSSHHFTNEAAVSSLAIRLIISALVPRDYVELSTSGGAEISLRLSAGALSMVLNQRCTARVQQRERKKEKNYIYKYHWLIRWVEQLGPHLSWVCL